VKKIAWLIAAVGCLLATTQEAKAQYHNQFNAPNSAPLFHRLFVKQPLPAFQAAPWYLYWPYNAHFMTPAPLGLGTQGYAPGAYGSYGAGFNGGGGNPYFPATQGTPYTR